MKRKGITPIIAIIVLLLIVVALAGLAYTYIFGVLSGQIEGSFLVQPGGVFCDNVGGNNQISIIIRNTGTSTTLTESDFIVSSITNGTFTYDPISSGDTGTTFPTISAQSTGTIVTICNATAPGCGSGLNTVRLSTGPSTITNTVTCP